MIVLDRQAQLSAIATDFRDIHRRADDRQSVELAGDFGAEIVTNFPNAFRQFVQEEGDIAIAELLLNVA